MGLAGDAGPVPGLDHVISRNLVASSNRRGDAYAARQGADHPEPAAASSPAAGAAARAPARASDEIV